MATIVKSRISRFQAVESTELPKSTKARQFAPLLGEEARWQFDANGTILIKATVEHRRMP